MCDSLRVFISGLSKVLNGPPGPSVDSLGVGASSTNGRCSDGGKTVVAVLLVRAVGSRSTVVVPRAAVGSEGRRVLAPSSRFFRLQMVFTNCLSSRSDRAGTNFIIALASSLGWGGFDRRRWAGRKGSFTSWAAQPPVVLVRRPALRKTFSQAAHEEVAFPLAPD